MSLKESIRIDEEQVTAKIVDFIRYHLTRSNRKGLILGLSGGLDSACVAGLCVRATLPQNVLALIMPERDSHDDTVEDAKLVADTFGIETEIIDISPILERFGVYDMLPRRIMDMKRILSGLVRAGYRMVPKNLNPFLGGLEGATFDWIHPIEAYYRIKHRVRMVTLYLWAERLHYLVVGTSNKTEDMTGFFVKYGDNAADIMPIKNLYKTQVKQLARYLGVPDKIIKKLPSPDLLPGITDELALKLTYEKLDLILLGIEKNMDDDAIAKEVGVKRTTIKYVKRLINAANNIRSQPPGAEI